MTHPKTILIVAASPSDQTRLRLSEEVRDIDEGLQRSRYRDHFLLKQQWATQVRDLRRVMQKNEAAIVHFCGHGSGEQGIVLEDGSGDTQLVSTEALGNFFKLFAGKVECVLLNACFSEIQAKEIAKHIPCVIGMSDAIENRAAVEFAVAFYDSLAAGENYEKAYQFGCNAIEMAGIHGNLIPRLFKKETAPPRQEKNPPPQPPIIENADLLPYLPDRFDQELELGGKIMTHKPLQAPLVCIVHGQEEDCNDAFIDRIEKHSLKRILSKETVIRRYPFICDSFKSRDELHKKMWASLGDIILEDLFASPESIANAIAEDDCPVLLSISMSSEDCTRRKNAQNIDYFLEFWKNWPKVAGQRHLLLVCLSFNYMQKKKTRLPSPFDETRAINKKIREHLAKTDFARFGVDGIILTEMKKIRQSQVEEWAKLYLHHLHLKLQPQIQQLFKDRKAMTMQSLSFHLNEMLEQLD